MSVPTTLLDLAPCPPSLTGEPKTAPQSAGLAPAAMEELVQLFKLLADETRLKILSFLMHSDELNVRTLCGMLAQSQPAVSHHLALLKEVGLIECRRDGKHNFYRLVIGRCRAYLDCIFGVADGSSRRIRVGNAILSYGDDGSAQL